MKKNKIKKTEFLWKKYMKDNESIIHYLLLILSYIYKIIIFVRNKLYDKNIIKIKSVNKPVISVGNITVGGTGKTPVVEFIAIQLTAQNKKCSVISRGYGRKSKDKVSVVVSDGKEIFTPEHKCGDEAYMLARRLKNTCIILNKNRYIACLEAIENFPCDIIILDDAYQHRQMNRTLDILVIDGTNPFGNGKILPAGILREPLKNLCRADLILITKTAYAVNIDKTIAEIKKYNNSAPIYCSNYRFKKLRCLISDQPEKLNYLVNKTVTAVCGIGNPETYKKMLEHTGCKGINMITFPDHHRYTYKDVRRIITTAKLGDIIVATEKDAVKLKHFVQYFSELKDIYYITIRVDLDEEENFMNFINDKIK